MCCNDAQNPPENIVVSDWGADVGARWEKLTGRHRCLFIGPGSEVDAITVRLPQLGDVVVSTERPLLDVDIPPDLCLRPFATKGISPNSLLGDTLNYLGRLELIALPYVPKTPWPTPRSPRRYPQVTWTLDGAERLVGAFQARGAKGVTVRLESGGTGDVEYRVVARLFSVTTPYPEFPISPTGYPADTPAYDTLTSGHNEQYHLDASVDRCDAVWVYARGTGAETLTVSAEVHD